MKKINFEDGTKVSGAKVTIDEVDYPVTPAKYNGATPLSAYVMNKLQDNIEDAIDQKADSSDVYTKTETDTKLNKKQDKLTAGTGIEITGTNIINNIQGNYSTEEQRVGTWIDGKPLYRKVISSTLPKVETENVKVTKTVSIGADIKKGFIEKAYYYNTKDNQIVPIPFTFFSGQLIQTYMLLDGSLRLLSNSTYANEQPVAIIVCYTKTTDYEEVMKIKKKNTTIPINGKIVDTENVEDKTSNAPSLRVGF